MNNWPDITRATNTQILAWADAQPWAREMAACAQDAQWHAEGDVWTHTKMVRGELEKLAEWPILSCDEQLILLFTGLFHDAGKPATTRPDPETGRLRSPKHAQAGAAIARRVLRELGCDLETREAICRLVLFHGRPPYLIEKEDAAREVIFHSWLVSNRLLHLFAVADTRGRATNEMSRPEDNIHLWKLVAEENSCHDRPYPFANEHARFLFYRDDLSSLHYAPRMDYRAEVTLMAGLPGVGKDTWLARNASQLPVVSLDDLRTELEISPEENQGTVIQAAREAAREHLRAGTSFAFNATNVTRQTRKRWIDLFADYGARVRIVYLEPPLEVVRKQNRKRPEPVPEKIIARLIDKLEPPTWSEAHELSLLTSAATKTIS